jgi:uncharacterized protein YyaL (SSP411 family)
MAAIVVALCVTPAIAETHSEASANRLVHSGSPYLRQHAHNPVDWYPWGEEAVARARKENKPIFLSVGYSTCYWCHVAERTIYSNPSIAALMNEWFVNIKVDREERPDIDETYMLARQLLTGAGGWPNNVFLTPDLKPFFAGSYFPPEDQDERLGFPTILKLLHEEWQKSPHKIKEAADEVHAALVRAHDADRKPASVLRLVSDQWLAEARDRILAGRDSALGGFDSGGGPKFPQSPWLDLLITDYRLNGTTESLQTVVEALRAMAFGGIHDHLSGGMHRYSIEPTWSVPHFEKMLYDNAQLIGLYADVYAVTRDPLFRDLATDLARYLARRMTAPEGGFYTAEDADIEGKEGETYIWTKAEIEAALGAADADRLFSIYELTSLPGESEGPGVLRIRRDKADASPLQTVADLAPLRARLLEIRDRRRQPARDDKIVVALNGLAISGLSRAGTVLGEGELIELAQRAGEALWRRAFDEKSGMLHRYLYGGKAWGEGFLEDYALLGLGYLALNEATGELVWLERANALAAAIMQRFVKPDGAIATAAMDATSIVPPLDLGDGDTPSGTSAAYALLAHLGHTDPKLAEAATKIMAWVAPKLETAPAGWASFVARAAELQERGQAVAQQSILDSAAHVKATARSESLPDHDEIVITLTIDPGYHINANPASADYLIPTTVKLPGIDNATINYPSGQIFKPKFLPEGISVYQGSLPIKIELPHGGLVSARRSPLSIEVQACTQELCLPPATISVHYGEC